MNCFVIKPYAYCTLGILSSRSLATVTAAVFAAAVFVAAAVVVIAADVVYD